MRGLFRWIIPMMLCLLSVCSAASAQSAANISGTVTDDSGEVVPGASLSLSSATTAERTVVTDENGEFRLELVTPGAYSLRVVAAGFAERRLPVVVHPGEAVKLASIALKLATVQQEIDAIGQQELAEIQIHQEEKQRVFGVIPNFYVAYDPNTVPMTQKQKFKLAGRSVIDPVVFAAAAINAAVSQGTQTPVEWQQNATGYAERYGASYAGSLVGIGLSGAVYPAIFHQDPRYFYKGTGTWQQRARWSLKQAFEQKSDHGRWEPAYSNMLGDLSASLVTTAIYPHQSTAWGHTAGLDFGLNIAGEAFGDLMEEFVVPRLHWGHHQPTP